MHPLSALLFAPLLGLPTPGHQGGEAAPIRYGEAERLFDIADERIHESSGIAIGLVNPGVLWTHNDSGDVPRLFALDGEGALRAEVAVRGAEAVDWEDMGSFRLGERAFLLAADVGDNKRRRETYQLYLMREPGLPPTPPADPLEVESTTLSFRYPTGAENCEAVAVDTTSGRILLATRNDKLPLSHVFWLPLSETPGHETLLAEPIIDLPLQLVTSMDITPDGRRAVITTYIEARLYWRGADEGWAAAFAREPQRLSLPPRPQGEAVCFGPDGRSLLLSTEKLPTPVHRIPALD